MRYSNDRHHMQVEIDTDQAQVPADELTRMEGTIDSIGEAVQDFPAAELRIKVIRHPRSDVYHVEARLRLPGRTLFTGDTDAYLDSAFQRCARKLRRKVEAYREHPDRGAEEVAEKLTKLERDVVAPEDPDTGPVGAAVAAGDYRAFRNALILYEDWLRRRAGRWIQRYPEAEARVGDGLKIGDLVEEVYLNAFEDWGRRPAAVRVSEWLDSLIDPSLKALLRHPHREQENASLARTLRETPLP